MQMRELSPGPEHERVVECTDEAAGYHGIIAIHSTRLGPAVGGTRLWSYVSLAEALADVLRLSRAMSYKTALAGLALGGGKAVILTDERRLSAPERERLFLAHGRFVEWLGGRYITAEDVGTSPADMEIVRRETCHVGGLLGLSGDPSPHTARGVLRAMQAAARFRWGGADLAGRTVAIQGCGHVGAHLAAELRRAGALLIVADVDAERAGRVAREQGARVVPPEAILGIQADILAPCALGAVLDDETIPRLRVDIVCGAANNQLREPRHGHVLEERGIVYVPDYLANAGGVINGARDIAAEWSAEQAERAVEAIFDTTLAVLESARAQAVSAQEAADRLAERRLRGASGR